MSRNLQTEARRTVGGWLRVCRTFIAAEHNNVSAKRPRRLAITKTREARNAP
jgi:hypothetical protein